MVAPWDTALMAFNSDRGGRRGGIEQMWRLATGGGTEPTTASSKRLQAKSLMKLAGWLYRDHPYGSKQAEYKEGHRGEKSVFGILESLCEADQTGMAVQELRLETAGGKGSTVGSTVGRGESPAFRRTEGDAAPMMAISALAWASRLAPELGKVWLRYGAWCYTHGRSQMESIASTKGMVRLSWEEREGLSATIRASLPDLNEADLSSLEESIVPIASDLGRIYTGEESTGGAVLGGEEEETIEALPTALQGIALPAGMVALPAALVASIRLFQSDLRTRVLSFYREAVVAYTRYLAQSGGGQAWGNRDNPGQGGGDLETSGGDTGDNAITVVLRLLRLLVKHGKDMKDLFLEQSSIVCSISVWGEIVPQLFARVGHREPFVQEQVLTRLIQLADHSPEVVVYAAVVAQAPVQQGLSDAAGGSIDVIPRLLSHLSKIAPQLVVDVGRMIGGLATIGVLWEEKWHGVLSHAGGSIKGKINKMSSDALRVRANSTLKEQDKTRLIREKYDAIMKPIVRSLGRLEGELDAPAVTTHEQWFATTFHRDLKQAIQTFTSPEDPGEPAAAWAPLGAIAKQIARHVGRATELGLADVAPRLASITGSSIPMPGREGDHVTIQSFSPTFEVIATKTKPKKLVLIGSDGQEYRYLLKGKEDLHLDERIAQFLRVCNRLLASNPATADRSLNARHYAVIPLSDNAGLIQWVDEAIPLYQLYKGWHERKSIVGGGGEGDSASAPVTPRPPFRPMDTWSSKVKIALQKRGVAHLSSRKEWPVEILRSVLKELKAETPPDLLSKELWASAACSSDWWHTVTNFNRSVATMSMVGYILGLGDRHLDNILVDIHRGEVVHIDMGICFEKGIKLRIPEVVPFRLTQSIEKALGTVGLRGTFRIASEEVLSALRRNKETLLTLLEAFVYDPLVDWTKEGQEDEDRRRMDLEITVSLATSRIEELSAPLVQHQLRMEEHIVKLGKPLGKAISWMESWQHASSEAQAASQIHNQLSAEAQLEQTGLKSIEQEGFVVEASLSTAMTTMASARSHLEEALGKLKQGQSFHASALDRLSGSMPGSLYRLLDEASSRQGAGSSSGAWGQSSKLARGMKGLLDKALGVKDEDLRRALTGALTATSAMAEERPAVLRLVAGELERYRGYLGELPSHYHLEDSCVYWIDQIASLLEGGYEARTAEAQHASMEIRAAAGSAEVSSIRNRNELARLSRLEDIHSLLAAEAETNHPQGAQDRSRIAKTKVSRAVEEAGAGSLEASMILFFESWSPDLTQPLPRTEWLTETPEEGFESNLRRRMATEEGLQGLGLAAASRGLAAKEGARTVSTLRALAALSPLGRAKAMRPGDYGLLDGSSMDIAASMEAVLREVDRIANEACFTVYPKAKRGAASGDVAITPLFDASIAASIAASNSLPPIPTEQGYIEAKAMYDAMVAAALNVEEGSGGWSGGLVRALDALWQRLEIADAALVSCLDRGGIGGIGASSLGLGLLGPSAGERSRRLFSLQTSLLSQMLLLCRESSPGTDQAAAAAVGMGPSVQPSLSGARLLMQAPPGLGLEEGLGLQQAETIADDAGVLGGEDSPTTEPHEAPVLLDFEAVHRVVVSALELYWIDMVRPLSPTLPKHLSKHVAANNKTRGGGFVPEAATGHILALIQDYVGLAEAASRAEERSASLDLRCSVCAETTATAKASSLVAEWYSRPVYRDHTTGCMPTTGSRYNEIMVAIGAAIQAVEAHSDKAGANLKYVESTTGDGSVSQVRIALEEQFGLDGGIMEIARGVISFEQHRPWGLGAAHGSSASLIEAGSQHLHQIHTNARKDLERAQYALDGRRGVATEAQGKAESLISKLQTAEKAIKEHGQKQKDLKRSQKAIFGAVVQAHDEASNVLRTDVALRKECLGLLTSIGGITGDIPSAQLLHRRVEAARRAHRSFGEKVGLVVKGAESVLVGNLTEFRLMLGMLQDDLPQLLQDLVQQCPEVYSGLTAVGKECSNRLPEWAEAAAEAEAEEDEAPPTETTPQSPPPALERQISVENPPRATENKAGQERNATGQSILKRVRLKLQGRDKDSAKKQSVPEQVQWVTDQATSVDNLAVMYEGWTAWV